MAEGINTISLPLPLGMGKVNCYLIKNSSGFILIDTGYRNARASLMQSLANLGCAPGNLKLIILTHGDFDHTGNAEYLRKEFSSRIAIHRNDTKAAAHRNRSGNTRLSAISRIKRDLILRFFRSARFQPDIYLEDRDNLAGQGLDATVLHVPGHSPGSIAILTGSGSLFCGDLVINGNKPALNSLIDDPSAAKESLGRLAGLKAITIYPGHGKPFPATALPATVQTKSG